MPETRPSPTEPTAVDDVRRVRERLDRESAGDIRKHIAETNQIFEQLRQGLKLKPAASPKARPTAPINNS